MVKAWLFDLCHYPYGTEPEDYDPKLAAQVFADHLREWEVADELGFDGLFLGEHHFTSYTMTPSPNVLLGAVTQRTKRMRIGTMINVTAFNHALRLAEEAAMLDLLSGGRLELGLGRGIDEQEFIRWNRPYEEARGRFEESIELVSKAFTNARFTHDGEYFGLGDEVSMWPRPMQTPHPRIWVTALSPATLEWAGSAGLPMSSIFLPIDKTKEAFDRYLAAAAAAGNSTSPDQLTLARNVFVFDTDEEAQRLCEEPLNYLFKLFVPHALPKDMDLDRLPQSYSYYKEFFRPFAGTGLEYQDLLDLGIVIAGSPETVRDRILDQAETLGFGNFMAWMNFGNMPSELAMKSERLFAEHVLPALHDFQRSSS